MEKRIMTFEAIGETGQKYILEVYQEYIDARSSSGPNAFIPGMKEIVTGEGHKVNRIGKGEYKIVQTGEILKSSDVNAP